MNRGSNYPSPEEAARMCVLLQTTPEEILLHEGATEAETQKCQADIALVRGLIEQEREKSMKETAPISESGLPEGYEQLTPANRAIVDRLIADLAKSQSNA